MTGKPVVAFMLDGMPPIYRDFIYEIPFGKISFEKELLIACERRLSKLDFSEYAKNNLESHTIVEKIIDIHMS
jgi:hypothetical protein